MIVWLIHRNHPRPSRLPTCPGPDAPPSSNTTGTPGPKKSARGNPVQRP
jgi:hypothetical protein